MAGARRGYRMDTNSAPDDSIATAANEGQSMPSEYVAFLEAVSQWMIPAMILLIIVWGALKRVPLYESFVTGAKEGFNIAVMIIPYLVAMLVVIKVFMASGIFEDIKSGLTLAMQYLGIGKYAETLDMIPLFLTKPLTGSGARAVLVDLFNQHGPDSFIGLTASIFMGSTETTFYLLTVYYGAIHVKKCDIL